MSKPHSGRLQAQSNSVEESEAWAQDEPPTWQEGLNMLDDLNGKLSKKEQEKREKQFKQAERYIRNAGKGGGIQSPKRKSFVNNDYNDGTRVDIEVLAGWFAVAVCICLLVIFLW